MSIEALQLSIKNDLEWIGLGNKEHDTAYRQRIAQAESQILKLKAEKVKARTKQNVWKLCDKCGADLLCPDTAKFPVCEECR